MADLSADDRRVLLGVARRALESALAGCEAVQVPDISPLRERRGAFVTLRCGGELRGCIGHVPPDRPLGETVARMAVSAATEDHRFPPVSAEELAGLRIEISVLSEPARVSRSGAARLRPGRDGVIVRQAGRQSLLLPQVATEFGWDAEALLAAACRKAGLPPGAWRESGSELYLFQVDSFGE